MFTVNPLGTVREQDNTYFSQNVFILQAHLIEFFFIRHEAYFSPKSSALFALQIMAKEPKIERAKQNHYLNHW